MVTINSQRLSAEEYTEFLSRTDLGSQYPRERFNERIATLVQKASISLVARNEMNEVVGVCFAITDFAYWLFITDLGIDREYIKQGIGTRLLDAALECAGGKENIIVYTCANPDAVPFYEKWGMKKSDSAMVLNSAEWTEFTVGK